MAGASARIFNSTLAGVAIAALDELGFLAALDREGEVELDGFCREHSLDRPALAALVYALACVGVVAETDGIARPGQQFAEVFRDKGYFLWLVRGYGDMLRDAGSIARTANRSGEFFTRDGKYIALAGRDYGARYVDRDFRAVLDARPFRVLGDIGCGSAERIISLARENPELRCYGIEVNPGAVEVARTAVARAGLADRIRIKHADARDIGPDPELAEVEVLTSFFMGHDLWPRDECRRILDQLHAAFPSAERFLLCDTYRSDVEPAPDVPTFTLGFELTHALMGQRIPSAEEWLELFEETRWTCAGQHPIGIPFSAIFDLRRELTAA